MKLIYVIDYCFQQTSDGTVWTDTSYGQSFWEPYLSVYDEVIMVCRARQVRAASTSWRQVNSKRIRVRTLTNYNNAFEYVRVWRKIDQQLRETFEGPGTVMLRVPSNLARCAAHVLKAMDRPYGVDVVGDPWHAMAPGVVKMKGRAIFRMLFTSSQRRICANAAGVSYVASTLPELYPAGSTSNVLVCSDVRLDRDWMIPLPRAHSRAATRLITVATLTQMYKGIDVLLRSLTICKHRGFFFHLTIVGTGRHRDELERYAEDLGIQRQVCFVGALPWGPQLMSQLDQADVFVLPSLVEVMPRALLEAMARALPAVATNVGAVSHVLAQDDIVEPRNAIQMTDRIIEVTQDPARLDQMSSRNLATAREHAEDALRPKWLAFHREMSLAYTAKEQPNNSSTSMATSYS